MNNRQVPVTELDGQTPELNVTLPQDPVLRNLALQKYRNLNTTLLPVPVTETPPVATEQNPANRSQQQGLFERFLRFLFSDDNSSSPQDRRQTRSWGD